MNNMTVSEFRQSATNIIHEYDDMDITAFILNPSISYTDKLKTIYGYIGSNAPILFAADVKNILNIDISKMEIPSNT